MYQHHLLVESKVKKYIKFSTTLYLKKNNFSIPFPFLFDNGMITIHKTCISNPNKKIKYIIKCIPS